MKINEIKTLLNYIFAISYSFLSSITRGHRCLVCVILRIFVWSLFILVHNGVWRSAFSRFRCMIIYSMFISLLFSNEAKNYLWKCFWMATKRVRAHNLQPQFLLEFSVCSSVFLSNSECLGLWVCLWWLLYISCSFDSLVSHGLQRRFFLPVSRAHRVTIVLPGYFSWIPECAFAHLTVIESNVLSMCFRSVIFMMLELHQYINNIFFSNINRASKKEHSEKAK